MEEFMGNKTSEIIYAQRKQNYLTQEQLAQEIGVSSVAVSKWERGISIPDKDILCRLADYFKITVDELLGRKICVVEENDVYTKEIMKRFALAQTLLNCSRISRENGLLAMESYLDKEDEESFLKFAVIFVLDGFQKGLQPECVFELLKTYAGNEPDEKETYMITDVLQYIIAGEPEKLVREAIASHMGRKYRNHFMNMENKKESRKDILTFYKERKQKPEASDLLKDLLDCQDEKIQFIIKNTDNKTFVAALSGASNEVCIKFLSNLSDRLLYVINEDIRQYEGTEQEVTEAQRRILNLSKGFLQK